MPHEAPAAPGHARKSECGLGTAPVQPLPNQAQRALLPLPRQQQEQQQAPLQPSWKQRQRYQAHDGCLPAQTRRQPQV